MSNMAEDNNNDQDQLLARYLAATNINKLLERVAEKLLDLARTEMNPLKKFKLEMQGKVEADVANEVKDVCKLLQEPVIWFWKDKVKGDKVRVMKEKVKALEDKLKEIANVKTAADLDKSRKEAIEAIMHISRSI